MIGKTISHYKILEKLGEGGMGVVYKAGDTKLKRTVALKFLSHQAVGTEEDKSRFVHEAQAAAALNHPNICTVYEIGQHEGRPFIAMEYVEGESLRARIASGPLPLNEGVRIALEIAEGLQEAHHKGIVHRDVKSSNIMIATNGRVKIMDFGLAKSPEKSDLTKNGTTLGTVAYMSPEQARGEAADQRSDIWSLGVVMYEMIAGSLPFKGAHDQAIVYSILNEDPPPLTNIRSGVPMDLERTVDKCLAKDSAARYQNIADLIVDLRRLAWSEPGVTKTTVTAGTPMPGRNQVVHRVLGTAVVVVLLATIAILIYPRLSGKPEVRVSSLPKVAVLFFENLGPPDDEYFANGITDAITARLSAIHGLGVISRQST
ncbi:MAG: serine/threonine-protein kinase, partial [Candidatus Latescibacterota bacterium]